MYLWLTDDTKYSARDEQTTAESLLVTQQIMENVSV